MKKQNNKQLSWLVKNYDCNRNIIENYDVLKYREEFIKKLKKKNENKEMFSELLRREMMYYYWSRAEYELILRVTDEGRIILAPWVGCSNPKEVEIDVTDDTDFDWKGFSEYCKHKFHGDKYKIDIWEQINYRFDEFVNYCWNYRELTQRIR